ncbi:MAG: CDC27 family protein [Pirellulaceae bacterium]|nr:CDC27 family protein [Pirellulaceae bacterium]
MSCRFFATLLLAAGLAVGLVGCAPQTTNVPQSPPTPTRVASSEDLNQALASLRRMAMQGDSREATRTIFYLNQWMDGGKGLASDWKPDPMVERLPAALRVTTGLRQLASVEFKQDNPSQLFSDPTNQPGSLVEMYERLAPLQMDLRYLQESQWLHDVADRARRDPSPASLSPWFKELESSLGLHEAEQLAAAERVFDWTIRNIQLDPLPPVPPEPAASVGGQVSPIVAAMEGKLGPGYGHTPLQILLQGRGDAHERGRLFVLLCRQLGIDAVMLGRIDDKAASTPRPWVAGVLLRGELYLFDPALGLPIPGPEAKGIATLSQVLADDAVLAQLNLPDAPYGQTRESLKNLVALLECQPEGLSRRMQLLEEAFPPAERIVLATSPSKLEPELRKVKGIATVSLWRVPFEAILYQTGRQLTMDAAARLEFVREEEIFTIPEAPLLRARNLHLQGEFEDRDRLPGARRLYLDSRLADNQRELIYTNEQFRQAMGFYQPLPEKEDERKEVLETIVIRFQRIKEHATYWLALTFFDDAKYTTAIEWLDERVVGAPLPSPWLPGARYNLARCYEALGETEKAVALYEADDSPQRHGNRLRGKWLADANRAKAEDGEGGVEP